MGLTLSGWFGDFMIYHPWIYVLFQMIFVEYAISFLEGRISYFPYLSYFFHCPLIYINTCINYFNECLIEKIISLFFWFNQDIIFCCPCSFCCFGYFILVSTYLEYLIYLLGFYEDWGILEGHIYLGDIWANTVLIWNFYLDFHGRLLIINDSFHNIVVQSFSTSGSTSGSKEADDGLLFRFASAEQPFWNCGRPLLSIPWSSWWFGNEGWCILCCLNFFV